MHETLEASNRAREGDRVEFSDELRRLNDEQRLRNLGADQAMPAQNEVPDDCPPLPPKPVATAEPDRTETVHVVEHRYETTLRSTTGRLIDMLM